jgi:hypothetical protein
VTKRTKLVALPYSKQTARPAPHPAVAARRRGGAACDAALRWQVFGASDVHEMLCLLRESPGQQSAPSPSPCAPARGPALRGAPRHDVAHPPPPFPVLTGQVSSLPSY